jgi:hypothetical protein
MFYPMADMMKQMGRLGPGDRMRAVQMMTQQVQQGAYGQNQKKGTGKTPDGERANGATQAA